MKTEDLFKEIIPYCSENFITCKLFEEGNYCWQLNLWQIVDLNNVEYEDVDILLEDVLESVIYLRPGFAIYYDKNERLPDRKIFVDFEITQHYDDILDENFVYNYNINDYMEVAITLLKEFIKVARNRTTFYYGEKAIDMDSVYVEGAVRYRCNKCKKVSDDYKIDEEVKEFVCKYCNELNNVEENRKKADELNKS